MSEPELVTTPPSELAETQQKLRVEQRKVEVGPVVDTMRVIEKGIAADDRVVVGGLLRAIPGNKVDPQTQSAQSAQGR